MGKSATIDADGDGGDEKAVIWGGASWGLRWEPGGLLKRCSRRGLELGAGEFWGQLMDKRGEWTDGEGWGMLEDRLAQDLR